MVHFLKTGTSGDKGTLRHMMVVALRCCIFDSEVFAFIHCQGAINAYIYSMRYYAFLLVVCFCVAFIEQLHSDKRIL